MVRTKADACTKAVGAKSTRKPMASTPGGSSSTGESKGAKHGGGGNMYCPRETPAWQKEITNFFQQKSAQWAENNEGGGSQAAEHGTSAEGSSSSQSKQKVEEIESKEAQPGQSEDKTETMEGEVAAGDSKSKEVQEEMSAEETAANS